MTTRVYNFGAGPATLPAEVLAEARENLLSLGDLGIGILEVSHRSKEFTRINEALEADIRKLTGAGDDWAILFVGGGASTQFYSIPSNLGADADYVVTGAWAKKALKEAKNLGNALAAATSEATGFDRIPLAHKLRPEASYLHITANNTIFGTQWRDAPETGGVPLVCDASSEIFSRPIDLDRYGLIYAGAQKNLGPAGVTLVMVRRKLLERSKSTLPTMINYNTHVEKRSCFNTPPVFPMYVVGLVVRWLLDRGGLAGAAERNERKAAKLYACIDRHALYRGHAQTDSRSLMNVPFRLTTDALEPRFLEEALEAGMHGLKGHRSVGGIRASIYNAMPEEGVDALVAFMDTFAKTHG